MAQYKLTKMKLNRDGKTHKVGDVVDLNEKEAEVMAWGIEPITYYGGKSDTSSAKSETPSQMAARDRGMGTDLDTTTADLDITVLDGNALSVKEYINSLDDFEQLEALRKAEVDGKARSGVINAIDARMEELTA